MAHNCDVQHLLNELGIPLGSRHKNHPTLDNRMFKCTHLRSLKSANLPKKKSKCLCMHIGIRGPSNSL